MTVLVTGAAGFIGFSVAQQLLREGRPVVGVDSLNSYYPPALKQARLAELNKQPGFSFWQGDITELPQQLETGTVGDSKINWQEIDTIIHLAAQPGVRYSLENPYAYVDANVTGQVAILELARSLPRQPHVVYASSSSVYGRNTKMPWSEEDRTDHPASVYAATKQAAERLADTYGHLYGLKLTGLRFFTVYGPWGRPDMAPYLFTKALFDGSTIRLFNHGKQQRDFTFIDDIVAGVIAAIDRPIKGMDGMTHQHRVYNLGNNQAEELEHFVAVLEDVTGRKAILDRQPAQPGDVVATYADITRSQNELGFSPKTGIAEGLGEFVAWYRQYHGIT